MTWYITVAEREMVAPLPIPLEWILIGAGILIVAGTVVYYEKKRREELMMAMLRR